MKNKKPIKNLITSQKSKLFTTYYKGIIRDVNALQKEVIVIEGVESMDYCGDRVVWRWSNERRLRRSWTREVKGNTCFRVNRQWIPLDECIQVAKVRRP